MNTKSLADCLYSEAEKLTRGTPFTLTGWLLIITLLSVPLLLGFSYAGYQLNTQLIKLQSRTNGMEHTDNYRQLHKGDDYEQASTQKATKE